MPTYELFLSRRVLLSQQVARRDPVYTLARAVALIGQWIERARQRQALATLDDHVLRDIGITRCEAARECDKPFWK